MKDDGTRNSTANPGAFGSDWDVAGVADFNTDGVADILWRDENNGDNNIWLMKDGGTLDSIADPGAFDPAWDVVGM